MSFRKEVRVFMQDMRMLIKVVREFIKVSNLEKSVYEKVLARQDKEITELRDRLFARDLPEFKTYQFVEVGTPIPTPKYCPEQDDALAGESAEI